MAMDCSKLPGSTSEVASTNITMSITARLTLLTTTLVGLFFVSRAVASSNLEWGLLAIVAFTVVLSTLTADIRRRLGSPPLSIPLSHIAMFAGALALGPAAALPGAFGGISVLVFCPPQKRSFPDVLFIIFKPAAVCALASAAFAVTGGELLQPHSVNSIAPALIAALVYVAGHVLLTAGLHKAYSDRPRQALSGSSVVASWSICILGGYCVAVLYSAVPPYVMIAPTAACVLALVTSRAPQAQGEAAEAPVDQVADDTQEQDQPAPQAITPSVFMDELTGLASHRYLMMFLDREVARSLRTASPLAVAAFDIDGFSRMENANGLIVELGKRLKSGVRDYDLVARHASGRLVMVLPDTSINAALEVCKRLHNEVSSIAVDNRSVSISVGIAMLPDNGTSSEDLINASHYAINRGRFSGKGGVYTCERLDKAS